MVLIDMGYDLQNRLIEFTGLCIKIKGTLMKNYECEHLSKQLIRSSSGAALNYAESQGAESIKDFIHKQSILLKELRESYVNLIIIERNNLSKDLPLILKVIDENNQLISIFVKSIKTSKNKLLN